MDPTLFLADLEQIPASLERLAGHLDDAWSSVDLSGVQRVLFLGMGSSRYASEAVAQALRADGVAAVAEAASVEATWPPGPGLLTVAVSATGGSVETVAAAERYAEEGFVALVEKTDSPLAAMARDVVQMQAGSESGGVACRTYRHTLVKLFALRARLAGRGVSDLREATLRAAEATAALLEKDWLDDVLEALDGPDGIAVLAPLERRCSADQSALMVREGPRRQATASETGDWAHVDVYLAKTLDYRVLFLTGSRWDEQAMEWLVKRGSRVVPVGPTGLVRHPYDDDPLVRLLTETTVAELVAARWWADLS